MPGLDPGIHAFLALLKTDVDGRDIGERKRRRSLNGYAGHDDVVRASLQLKVD